MGVCASVATPSPPSSAVDSGLIIFYQPTGPLTCGSAVTLQWDYDQPELWQTGDKVDIELW